MTKKPATVEVLGELECDGIGTYQITQARTVVGRNSQTADLAIQSSNHVSRQHIEVSNIKERSKEKQTKQHLRLT